MQYTNTIYDLMQQKYLRLKIALTLDITEQSVMKAIKLKRKVLLAYPVVQLLKNELSVPERELFVWESEARTDIKQSMNSENKTTEMLVQAFPSKDQKVSKATKAQIIQKIKNDRLSKIN